MSITPQFLDQLRDRVPLSDVIGRFVTWDQQKSRPAQGDYWAPCPFHTEKTASFHADNSKGFYYCFGCHQKGDAITFLKEKGNMQFIEAVRELASMAGMEMPAMDPHARKKADDHARLVDMHERAARFFALQLNTQAGSYAREYLTNTRGLSKKTLEEFLVGFAPAGRDGLINHLREGGFSDEDIVLAGLAIQPDEGGAIFDRFRNRIMFPIHDARARVIAFGGRAMDPEARAKYLNSPETPLFHKGRVVYNLHRARNHFDQEQSFVLTEGYMDVIALWQAGMRTGLAPLGTAVTLDQLDAIWRIDRAPVVALDGDEAGQRAATRVANLALPQISPDRTLRFALLPPGQDPDDIIRANGMSKMREILKRALTMADMLWQNALAASDLSTPEGRAGFDSRLKAVANQIENTSLRAHYLVEFRERRKALFASAPDGKVANVPRAPSKIIPFNPNSHQDFRVALILRTILTYPELGRRFMDDLSEIGCPNPKLEKLRRDVLMAYGDVDAIRALATPESMELLEFGNVLNNLSFFAHSDNETKALDVSTDEIARITIQSRAREEINQILRNLQNQELDEEQEALLRSAVIMRDEARKILDDQEDDDEDKRAFLRQFLESERWRK